MEFILANNFPSDGEKVQGVYFVGLNFSPSNKISKLNSPGKLEVSITVGNGGIFPTLDGFSAWTASIRLCLEIYRREKSYR